MEAALLWQALCINISQDAKGLMKVVLPNLLQQVLEKLLSVSQKTLKKALYGTLMAAFIQDQHLTLQVVMSSDRVLQSLASDLQHLKLNSRYERKLFTLG